MNSNPTNTLDRGVKRALMWVNLKKKLQRNMLPNQIQYTVFDLEVYYVLQKQSLSVSSRNRQLIA